MTPAYSSEVDIRMGKVHLKGVLDIPKDAHGAVLFAHGSGSGRLSPRNRFVAEKLYQAKLATLLFDLLTAQEEKVDVFTAEHRFNIPMLAKRLAGATDWFGEKTAHSVPIGYFGASTGAAAALIAATERPETVKAVVSRGGRPDLASEEVLRRIKVPTLFIVGGNDLEVLELNRTALALVPASHKRLAIVPHAGHLFEETGTMEEMTDHAASWFSQYLISEESLTFGPFHES